VLAFVQLPGLLQLPLGLRARGRPLARPLPSSFPSWASCPCCRPAGLLALVHAGLLPGVACFPRWRQACLASWAASPAGRPHRARPRGPREHPARCPARAGCARPAAAGWQRGPSRRPAVSAEHVLAARAEAACALSQSRASRAALRPSGVQLDDTERRTRANP